MDLGKEWSHFFPLATWLSCTKHVEDDVTCKLKDLRIGELERKDFLLDIFGSDTRREVGLIDTSSPQEFDVILDSLYPVWTKREMDARSLSKEASTKFYPYFLTNVATDMIWYATKPLWSTRRERRKSSNRREALQTDRTICQYENLLLWLGGSTAKERQRKVSLFRSLSTKVSAQRTSYSVNSSSTTTACAFSNSAVQDKEESDADYLDNPVASTSEVAVQGRLYSASSSSTTTSHALQVSAVQDEVESDNDYLDNPVFSTSKFAIQGRSYSVSSSCTCTTTAHALPLLEVQDQEQGIETALRILFYRLLSPRSQPILPR